MAKPHHESQKKRKPRYVERFYRVVGEIQQIEFWLAHLEITLRLGLEILVPNA